MKAYHLVQERMKEDFKFKFDDKSYAIRRNLMIASTIVIASTFVSPPPGGEFEVNIGIVKGVLKNPEYLYYFLGISCIYYLLWFYIHCRYLAFINYRDIKHRFFYFLSSYRAKEAYETVYNNNNKCLPKPPSFEPMGGGGSSDQWSSQVNFAEKVKDEYPEGLNYLKLSGFSVGEHKDLINIHYKYTPTHEDYNYLKFTLDLFWRLKWSQVFTTVLPIVYAAGALLLLSFHIYEMCKS